MSKKTIDTTEAPQTLKAKIELGIGEGVSVVEGYPFGREPDVPCIAVVDDTRLVLAAATLAELDTLTEAVQGTVDVATVSPLYGNAETCGRVWRTITVKPFKT